MKPLIMVTNDDSVNAPGLYRLIDVLREFGQVIAVAPSQPQSGMSSAISVNKALRINALPDYGDSRVFSVNGTPVDCVKLGLAAVMPRKPDFLFSGINHGSNSGTAITYSGTMGAAMEGTMAGIISVGFSLLHHSLKADFSFGLPFIRDISAKVIENGLAPGICLNVNIPAKVQPRGVRVCRAAHGHWSEEYSRYLDPEGHPFYWLTGRFVNEEPQADDTDEYWLQNQYISIVPARADQSATEAIPRLSGLYDCDNQR